MGEPSILAPYLTVTASAEVTKGPGRPKPEPQDDEEKNP